MTGVKTLYRPPQYLAERPRLPAPDWMFDWFLAAKRAWWDDWAQPDGERTWRASSLGYCLRKQTLERRGIEPTSHPDAKTYRTFAYGDMVHDWVRKMFWTLGLVIAEEPTFTDTDRDITGHVDLIWSPTGIDRPMPDHWSDEYRDYIRWLRAEFATTLDGLYPGDGGWEGPNGETDRGGPPADPIGAEIKSAHSNAMKRLIDEGPYPWHRTQAGIYKHMAQTTGPLDIGDAGVDGTFDPAQVERWQVIYVGKDSTGMLAFEVEDGWVDDALERLDDLNRFWQAGTLPPCSCEGWWVGSCSYNEGDTCCGRQLKGRVAADIRKGTIGAKNAGVDG